MVKKKKSERLRKKARKKGKKIEDRRRVIEKRLVFTIGGVVSTLGFFLLILSLFYTISETGNFYVSSLGWFLLYLGIVLHLILIKDKPFSKSLDYLKKIKNYFWFSLFLFFGVGVLGFLFPYFFEEQILGVIEELIMKTQGLGVFELIRFIMFNNIKSGFLGFISGIFLSLSPVGVVIVNGYILGFVANKTVAVEGFLVLGRLLPHGIFEIPAIMICAAMGIKLGLLFFYNKDRAKTFLAYLTSVVLFLIISGLLLIATSSFFSAAYGLDLEELSKNVLYIFISLIILLVSFGFSVYASSFVFPFKERSLIFKNFKKEFKNMLRVFLFIVVPLLILAAFVEGILVFLIS